MNDAPVTHMLSFDVEEYFHCEVFREIVGPGRWDQWPSRVERQIETVLELLARRDTRATFFVLAGPARSAPRAIRRIADAGHEIACHGASHEMLGRLGAQGFAAETRDSKALLEDLVGAEVRGYRAPTFSVNHDTAWALDVLAELGFAYDSSVQPVAHDRYGVPTAPRRPHWATGPGGGRVLEIPPMTARLLGRNWPLGGGGFFRLLPTVLFERELARWARRGDPAMLYLHPWEFDPDQPRIPVGRASDFRHRVNLARTANKLDRLLARRRFGPVAPQLDALGARAAGPVHYGQST